MIGEQARQRIEAAIGAAEGQSRAELVAVVARRASEYRATGIAVATIGAFLAGILVWVFVPWSDTSRVLLAEFGIFLVLLTILELTPLGDRLTPRYLQSQAAARLARSAFLELGLSGTPERNGVMFFVSAAERHVEIIADLAIDAKVDQTQWQKVVDDFASKVKAGDIEAGYLQAIDALAAILATHFPVTGDRPNTVSNRLVRL